MSKLADAILTKTQQNVLGLLYGRPDRSFYTKEILRLTGMGVHTIKRELDRMLDAGIITLQKIGNQNHYQANPGNPIYGELKGIVDKTFGVTGILSEALQPILAEVDFAFVYGSVAKSEEHADSDIDLMLVGDALSYTQVMDLLLRSEEQLGRTVNPTLYSPEEFNDKLRKQQSFLNRVVGQNKLWLQGEDLFASQYMDVS